MQVFESFIGFLDGYLGSAVYFPFLLLAVGLFFTLYLGFPQIRFFRHAWSVLRGKQTSDPTYTAWVAQCILCCWASLSTRMAHL